MFLWACHWPTPVRFNWIVFARKMHSTTKFAKIVLSKCVNHLYRCKTSFHCRGHGSCFPSHANEAMEGSVDAHSCTCINSPTPGALKSQLGGHIIYRCCFILSLCPVIIYIYRFISSCCLVCWCFCTTVAFHITIRSDVWASVQVRCAWEIRAPKWLNNF